MYFRNPLVWLARFRHRRGYGIHSPFAYDMLTQVIYSPGRYYDYEWLDAQFSRCDRLFSPRRMVVARLLFRLTNRWQPRLIFAPDVQEREKNYLRSGCRRAEFVDKMPLGIVDFIYLSSGEQRVMDNVGDNSMLVVDYLQKNKVLWKSVLHDHRTRVTFDIFDVGIAIFNPGLQHHNYIVNW